MAIKGRPGSVPWMAQSAPSKRRTALWLVGVDGIKTALFGRLQSGSYVRFAQDLPLVYFEQLCGERMHVRYRKGSQIREFLPVRGRRNEALDCMVYAMAAHNVLTMNWDRRESQLREEPQAAARPRVIESAWMQSMMAR